MELCHCTGNGNIFFSPPQKYFLFLDLPNEGIFQKLNVAVQFHRSFCSMNILTKEEKWPFLLLFLSVCGAAVGSEILITIRQRLICLPPPVKKSNNCIIQPSYTTDAQKCDKTLLRIRKKWPLYCPQGSGTLRQQLLMMHCIACYSMAFHCIA